MNEVYCIVSNTCKDENKSNLTTDDYLTKQNLRIPTKKMKGWGLCQSAHVRKKKTKNTKKKKKKTATKPD